MALDMLAAVDVPGFARVASFAAASSSCLRCCAASADKRRRSDMLSPIDMQLRPGDVGALLRTQIIDRLGDFFRRAEPSHRDALHQLFGARRKDGGEHPDAK